MADNLFHPKQTNKLCNPTGLGPEEVLLVVQRRNFPKIKRRLFLFFLGSLGVMTMFTFQAKMSTTITYNTKVVYRKLVNVICEQRLTVQIIGNLLLFANPGSHKSMAPITLINKRGVCSLAYFL